MKTFGDLSNIDDVYLLEVEVCPSFIGCGTYIRCTTYKRSNIFRFASKDIRNLCVLKERIIHPYKYEFHANKKTLLHSIRNSFINVDDMNILSVRTLFQQLFKMRKLHS